MRSSGARSKFSMSLSTLECLVASVADKIKHLLLGSRIFMEAFVSCLPDQSKQIALIDHFFNRLEWFHHCFRTFLSSPQKPLGDSRAGNS
jgi:hypothetical protein